MWFQKLSVVATYVIEIAVPLLFFAPIRRLRLFAFYCQVRGALGHRRGGCMQAAAPPGQPAQRRDAPSPAFAPAQVLLQVLIILTGNYNFFNALTIVLAFSLLDEEHVAYWLGRSKKKHGSCESGGSRPDGGAVPSAVRGAGRGPGRQLRVAPGGVVAAAPCWC